MKHEIRYLVASFLCWYNVVVLLFCFLREIRGFLADVDILTNISTSRPEERLDNTKNFPPDHQFVSY
jgi:hypothetical protein